MNKPIRPKLKPQPVQTTPERPAPIVRPTALAKLAVSQLESGETEGLNHLATLGGLGLLAELAHVGEHIAGASRTVVSGDSAQAIDPRDRIDPRKRFLPR